MIDQRMVDEFLEHQRWAVIGASDDERNFGRTIYTELRDHGYHPVAVHPTATTVAGDPCYPDITTVPSQLDGAIVMVGAADAVSVVEACLERGVPRIWLFKGVGSKGAVSDEAIAACEEAGVPVVAGACPLMFLEPVAWFHRVHRSVRRATHGLSKAA